MIACCKEICMLACCQTVYSQCGSRRKIIMRGRKRKRKRKTDNENEWERERWSDRERKERESDRKRERQRERETGRVGERQNERLRARDGHRKERERERKRGRSIWVVLGGYLQQAEKTNNTISDTVMVKVRQQVLGKKQCSFGTKNSPEVNTIRKKFAAGAFVFSIALNNVIRSGPFVSAHFRITLKAVVVQNWSPSLMSS